MPTLTFLGAARTVTGSKHLLDGRRPSRARRLRAVPGPEGAAPAQLAGPARSPRREIDAVVLTHAHLDHCGYLPRLVAQGFRGPRSSARRARPTCAARAARLGAASRKKTPSAPTARLHASTSPRCRSSPTADAARALTLLQPVGYDRPVPVAPGVDVEFINAGHLLGSAYARVHARGERPDDPLRRRSRPLRPAGAARSVAGRDGRRAARRIDLRRSRARAGRRRRRGWRRSSTTTVDARRQADHSVVRDRPRRGSALLASTRSKTRGAIPVLPVYVDSPMAADGAGRLPPSATGASSTRARPDDRPRRTVSAPPRTGGVRVLHGAADGRSRRPSSRARSRRRASPAIVISSSGMATGGRVLHHLERGAARPAEHGALRRLPGGRHARPHASSTARTTVKIHGQRRSRCARGSRRSTRCRRTPTPTRSCAGSAASRRRPRMTYLVHGEPGPMDALKARIERELQLDRRHVAAARVETVDSDSRWTASVELRVTTQCIAMPVTSRDSQIADGPALPARAGRRRGRRAALRRRLRGAAARREDCSSGISTRRRSPAATSTTTSATRTTSRCATCSRRSSRTPTGVDAATLAEIQRYTKLFWINTGPYNNLTARKFVLTCTPRGVRRGGAGRRAARRDVSARGRRDARRAARAAAADVLRSRRRSDRHEQDAGAGQGHPRRRAPTTCTPA